jgi:hypothetical protein
MGLAAYAIVGSGGDWRIRHDGKSCLAVIARSSCDEAIHSLLATWIASQELAMTNLAV